MDSLWDTVYQMANSVAEPYSGDAAHAARLDSGSGSGQKKTPKTPKTPKGPVLLGGSLKAPPVSQVTTEVTEASGMRAGRNHKHRTLLKKKKKEPAAEPDSHLTHHLIGGWQFQSPGSLFDELLGFAGDERRRSSGSSVSSVGDDGDNESRTTVVSMRNSGLGGISPVSGMISSTEIGSSALQQAQPQEDPAQKTYTQQMSDKFMQRIFEMVVPTAGAQNERSMRGMQTRIEMQKTRPAFNVQLISNNCVALLQRLSIPFSIIDNIIILFDWLNPVYTLCVLLTGTLLILKPALLAALPFFFVCFEVIVPAFALRHPGDPGKSLSFGPQVAVEYPKPVPELSREFFMNLTDLQNHMLIYIIPWNFLNSWYIQFFSFQDERITTLLFGVLLAAGILLTTFGSRLFVALLPLLKVLAVALLWAFTIALHPSNRKRFLEWIYSEDTRLKAVTLTNRIDERLARELDGIESRELKQLEIFEVQQLHRNAWQPVCFSSSVYPVNSHLRQNNMPINGCEAIADVAPPKGWCFPEFEGASSAWTLDLRPHAWVQDNYLDDVLDVDDGTKWCYDLQDGVRGRFRRRRWTRQCMRDVYEEKPEKAVKSSEGSPKRI